MSLLRQFFFNLRFYFFKIALTVALLQYLYNLLVLLKPAFYLKSIYSKGQKFLLVQKCGRNLENFEKALGNHLNPNSKNLELYDFF